MTLSPETYLIILRGRCIGTVCYMHGLLLTVTLTSSVREDVIEVMIKLPALEKNLFHPDEAVSFVNKDMLQIAR